MDDMMEDHFVIQGKLDNFLFKGWSASGPPSWVGLCSAMVGLTLLLEACRILQGYLKTQASANPLTYAQTESRISETSPLLRPLMIPASPSIIKKRRIKIHLLKTLIHILQLLMGYTLMLAVMSYNFWVFISVISASGIGYFLFGAVYDVYWRVAPAADTAAPNPLSADDLPHQNDDEVYVS